MKKETLSDYSFWMRQYNELWGKCTSLMAENAALRAIANVADEWKIPEPKQKKWNER